MNMEMNELLNPGSQTSSYSAYREESNIYVFGYTVSDSGTISLPILGEVEVMGLTINEVQSAISEKAKQYLKDAVINVKLLSFKFTVIGEVSRPGSYTNFNNQLTVLDAIGMAGDITDFGNRRHVLVLRPTREGTATYHIDLQDKNLLQSEGFFLLPNDIVIVEPIKSKPTKLNIPTYTLVITTSLSTISTLILLLNYLDSN
jgi:polysaccharide export outer membrane protein